MHFRRSYFRRFYNSIFHFSFQWDSGSVSFEHRYLNFQQTIVDLSSSSGSLLKLYCVQASKAKFIQASKANINIKWGFQVKVILIEEILTISSRYLLSQSNRLRRRFAFLFKNLIKTTIWFDKVWIQQTK